MLSLIYASDVIISASQMIISLSMFGFGRKMYVGIDGWMLWWITVWLICILFYVLLVRFSCNNCALILIWVSICSLNFIAFSYVMIYVFPVSDDCQYEQMHMFSYWHHWWWHVVDGDDAHALPSQHLHIYRQNPKNMPEFQTFSYPPQHTHSHASHCLPLL